MNTVTNLGKLPTPGARPLTGQDAVTALAPGHGLSAWRRLGNQHSLLAALSAMQVQETGGGLAKPPPSPRDLA